MSPPSWCCECDAPAGGCDHRGARYLAPIVYERTEGGWKVPDGERERWNNPPSVSKPPPAGEPTPLPRLVVELEAWIDLDPDLERRLRDLYEAEPVKVTRIAEAVVAKARAGVLRSPAGLLASRLRQLHAATAVT